MKRFDITKIKPDLGFTIKHRDMCLPNMRQIKKWDDYSFDFDVYLEEYNMNLQRPFCWTTQQQQQFIYSLLKDLSIPSFAVVLHIDEKRNCKVYKVIDGKQRLTTLLNFIDNKFTIPCGNDCFYFSQLPVNIQNKLLNWYPVGQMAYSWSDEKITDASLIKWYLMLNFAGTPQEEAYMEVLKSKL